MARNKYPEETVNRILDVSLKLFLEKGYDNTSIQDIINKLGGLSKGAIYHHFKSKESILLAVYDRLSETASKEMGDIRDDRHMNGLEKLREMFLSSWKNSEHRDFIASMPDLLEKPRLLAMSMSATIHDIVPNFILPVLEEGIQDGSIQTDCPLELANVLMLLSNVWMNPLIYPMTEENISSKIEIFRKLLSALDLELLYDGAAEHMLHVEARKKNLEQK